MYLGQTKKNLEQLQQTVIDYKAEISLPEGAKDMSGIILPEKLLEKLES